MSLQPLSTVPKRSMMEDFDDSDPLADFSLSDDDFFDDPKRREITESPGLKTSNTNSSILEDNKNSKENQAKKIADLFGLEKSAESSEIPDQVPKKDNADWLGLKEDSKPDTKADAKFDEINSKSVFALDLKNNDRPMTEPKDKMSNSVNSELDSSLRNRRRSEGFGIMKSAESKRSLFKSLDLPLETDSAEPIKRVSFSDTAKKLGRDDLFGNLDDLDDLLPDKTTSDPDPMDMKNPVPQEKTNYATDTSEKFQVSALNDYVPSLGSYSRRTGYGRRRESASTKPAPSINLAAQFNFHEAFPNTISSNATNKDKDKLAGPSLSSKQLGDSTRKNILEKSVSIEYNSNHEELVAQKDRNQFPSWLNDQRMVQTTNFSKTEEMPLSSNTTILSNPPEMNVPPDSVSSNLIESSPQESARSHIQSVVSLQEKSLVSEKAIQSLQQTHSQLLSVLKMRQQEEVMDSISARQLTILHKQEEQINQLIQKHLEKQLKAESIIEKQMQQINDIILALMSQPETERSTYTLNPVDEHERIHDKHEDTPMNGENESKLNKQQQIFDLEMSIQNLEFENRRLHLQIDFTENRHKLEIESTEKCLRYDLDLKEKREKKLTDAIEQLEKEYEEKINKLKNSELETINSFREQIDILQNERMEDFKKLNELQKTILEQTSLFSAQTTNIKDIKLAKSSSTLEINRPQNEEELFDREQILIEKERHLAVLRDALNRQKLALETERESIANKSEELEMKKMEQELHLDNERRQLKSDRNMFLIEQKAWEKEKESGLKQMEHFKKQVETMKDSVLEEKEVNTREKLELASERAQINAITKMQGTNLTGTIDLAQARAEITGTLEAAKQAEKALEKEKQNLLEAKKQLTNESWKLTEREQEITIREKNIKNLLEEAQRTKEEGLEALKRAKAIEKEMNATKMELQDKFCELESKEHDLLREKMGLVEERKELNRNKMQLEFLLPELSSEEKLLFQPMEKQNRMDKKLIIYQLPAAKMDEFQPLVNYTGHAKINKT